MKTYRCSTCQIEVPSRFPMEGERHMVDAPSPTKTEIGPDGQVHTSVMLVACYKPCGNWEEVQDASVEAGGNPSGS